MSENGLRETARFDAFFNNVCNIILIRNKLYIGMDKIVSVADIETGKVKAYTSISTEAEKNIMSNIKKEKVINFIECGAIVDFLSLICKNTNKK